MVDGIQLIEQIRNEKKEQRMVGLCDYEDFCYAQQKLLTNKEVSMLEEKGISGQFVKVENQLDFFQNSLSVNDYEAARKCIHKLYQISVEGLVRYQFLEWINHLVCCLILDQCEKWQIEKEVIFGKCEDKRETVLMEGESEMTCCKLLCGFVTRLEETCRCQESYSIRIQNVLKYLQENYYYNISLQNVAEHFGVHKVYLARSFKAETGETINEFLNKIRVEKAKLLLVITENKVNVIAYTVGFNTIQSFYSMFKKYTDLSPNEYRKLYPKPLN